jgi:hypothetical protein
MRKYLLLLIIWPVLLFAQESNSGTNNIFDDSELKEYSVNNILLEGEVENPGLVDLTVLPKYGFPARDLTFEKEKNKFNGAYFFSGYSLFDILDQKKVKKLNKDEFKPFVDLYLIVENDKGDKAVFSWGEIFYSKDNFKIIISKSVRAINPSKMKMKWPLPSEPVLVCGNDAFNYRFISNPTKITVKSFPGVFSKDRIKETYVPEIKVVVDDETIVLKDISGIEKRKFFGIGYGHGMGWKGTDNVEGFVFSEALRRNIKFSHQDIGNTIVCVSSKDGYRASFSLSELINRNDMNEFLLVEKTGLPDDGKYNLFATPDFFVDRNVRSVEKIELLKIK